MPNIFLCITWPIIIFLSILAFKRVRDKYSKKIAVIIAELAFIILVLIFSNSIAIWYNMGHFDISRVFSNIIILIIPWLPN